MVTLVQSDLWIFISETPEFCPWYLSAGSVYFGSPGWIWEYLFIGYCCYPFGGFSVMMVMYPPVRFISELPSWICGYSVPQMVVISSETRIQYSWCSDDLEDGTVTCIHASASFPFCIHLHLTHVYPYSGYILDWDSGWETSWCQNVIVKLLSVSMKPESKDRIFLIRIDIAFMRES